MTTARPGTRSCFAFSRTTAAETFAHALNLSLDFHQTKRSGTLSRTMDRGSRAVDFLLRILAFNGYSVDALLGIGNLHAVIALQYVIKR